MLRLRRPAALLLAAGATFVGLAPAAAVAHAPRTTGTICVALVVDARSIDGPVDADCATVQKGATGLDVLEAAGHRLTFREDHLLCTIDGLPRTGCSAVDDTHFWAYYHRAPGKTSWSYSSSGAGSYQPVNASTEGWVYEDGAKTEPDNVPYASICTAKTTPTPSPTRATHPRATHHPAATVSSPTPTPSPTTSSRAAHRAKHHRTQRRTPPVFRTTVAGTPTAGRSAAPAARPADGSSGSGHGTAIGVIVAALIVGGLGAAALASNRRRGRGD